MRERLLCHDSVNHVSAEFKFELKQLCMCATPDVLRFWRGPQRCTVEVNVAINSEQRAAGLTQSAAQAGNLSGTEKVGEGVC